MQRRIIVCCDGTWNAPDEKEQGQLRPTNVAKIADAICPVAADGTSQIVYYHDGVGVEDKLDGLIANQPIIERSLLSAAEKLIYGPSQLFGGAFGLGLSKIIQDAYRFLIYNFEESDQLYLIGFSRGAYTVRSLAGLIRNSGLLRKENASGFEEAYALYRDRGHDTDPRSAEAADFRAQFSRDIAVKFIGVWDTVGSLGIPNHIADHFLGELYKFHDARLSTTVENAYQALAIDEKRGDFRPALWERQADAPPSQVLEQVWFPGVHCDVGGGYIESGLSDCALEWMIEKAGACGLAFDQAYCSAHIKAYPCGVLHDSCTGVFAARPRYVRQIGEGNNSVERISKCALERKANAAAAYNPANLPAGLPEA
jgi:uncharacterized protein (DUF2235 family)